MENYPILNSGFITPQELKDRYGLSLTSQALLRTKKRQSSDKYPLPFIKISRKIYYVKSQLEEWLKAKQFESVGYTFDN